MCDLPIKEHVTVAKSSSCAEHYRAVAARFRERAAGTQDLQLRESYRDIAADYERLANLAEAEDRFRDRHSSP